jgi:DNA polymerase III sliding clamp (beta) subunit (PCNA family)
VCISIKIKGEGNMEFKIPVEELQSIMARLSTIVKINEDNITGMVLIEVGDDVKFKVTAGSINLIITNTKCEIIKTGKTLLRFRDVKGYISKFVPLVDDYGTKDFHFIVEGPKGLIKTKTHFQSGKPSYRRLSFELFKYEYPQVKPFGEAQLILNSSILKRGIGKVMHCIDPTEIRGAITGLNVVIKDDGISFVGTNGIKLSEFELDINADVEKSSHIFKYNFAYALLSVLDDDAQVFIKLEGRYAYIKSNDVYIVGSLIVNESYPNYKPMFDLESVITLPRLDFSDTVHTLMDVLDAEDNHRLTITFGDGKLLLKNDLVESVQDFDTPSSVGLDIDINGEYLDSVLSDFTSKELEVHFTTGNNYIVFKSPESDKHTALLTVVKRR